MTVLLLASATAWGADPAPDAAPPPTAPPPAPEPLPLDGAPEPGAAEADAAYLRALDAWNTGDTEGALALATRAGELSGGTLEPAALLRAYALLRVRRREEALTVLRALADNARTPEVKRAASRMWHRYADRNSRDEPSITGGLQVAGRFTGESLAIGAGYTLGYDQPLRGPVGFAVELSGYDTSAGAPILAGPVLDVLGSAHVPFGGSAWALRVKAGPSVWFSHGVIYGDELVPQLGTRAILGVDTRPWRAVGFSFDAGAWAWPGLAESLPAWTYEWDLRAGMVFWFSKPN